MDIQVNFRIWSNLFVMYSIPFFLVMVQLLNNTEKLITMPLLNTTYKLVQFHFHWSHDDKVGSEHTVFEQHFPLEVSKVKLW